MKTKFVEILAALFLPMSFMGVLFVLNAFPIPPLDKYGLGGVLVLFIALLITYFALKNDKKNFGDIGIQWEKKTLIRFVLGFFIGILMTVMMLCVVITFSSVHLVYNKDSNALLIMCWLLAFFPLAFMEELIFRGYTFIKINKSIGLWPAQILLALLFSWYHDFTGVTFFNQLLGPGVWALIFGITAVWSKGLAFPTGLHMAINVVLALVGEKDGRHALWNMEYVTEITLVLSKQTETIGLVLQGCILIIAVLLTEYYRRYKQKIT